MVIKVFLLGMLFAFVALILQSILQMVLDFFGLAQALILTLNIFIGAGLIEELVKLWAIQYGVFRNKDLDEPADLILYMIIAALGFAAVENMLYLNKEVLNQTTFQALNSLHAFLPTLKTLEFLSWRFISATFLHALCSGLLGYFLALSFCYANKKKLFALLGLALAAFLHGFYDWSIIMIKGPNNLIIPILILIVLGCFVSYGFRKLKKMKSVCKIKI